MKNKQVFGISDVSALWTDMPFTSHELCDERSPILKYKAGMNLSLKENKLMSNSNNIFTSETSVKYFNYSSCI
jgi:hypothetical protein